MKKKPKTKPFWGRPRNDAQAKALAASLRNLGDLMTQAGHNIWLLGGAFGFRPTPEQAARLAHRRIPR